MLMKEAIGGSCGNREEWVGVGVFRDNMDRICRWMGGGEGRKEENDLSNWVNGRVTYWDVGILRKE